MRDYFSPTSMNDDVVLRVEDLRTYFHMNTGVVKAIDGISFDLRRGETLGIVGESGCGKSMTAWSILGLVPEPFGRIESGRILYMGEDLLEKDANEMREIRGKGICMVMQDPLTSLNPVFSIATQMLETLKMDHNEPASRLRDAGGEATGKCWNTGAGSSALGLSPPDEWRYATAYRRLHSHVPLSQHSDCRRANHLS